MWHIAGANPEGITLSGFTLPCAARILKPYVECEGSVSGEADGVAA
jgi:hypothetical protein